jgi:hypothetical protein
LDALLILSISTRQIQKYFPSTRDHFGRRLGTLFSLSLCLGILLLHAKAKVINLQHPQNTSLPRQQTSSSPEFTLYNLQRPFSQNDRKT